MSWRLRSRAYRWLVLAVRICCAALLSQRLEQRHASELAGLLLSQRCEPLTVRDKSGLPLSASGTCQARGEYRPLAAIPLGLQRLVITAEDRRFELHAGVDWLAVGHARLANMRAGRGVSGASTLTMQLARLLRPVRRTCGVSATLLQAWDLENALGAREERLPIRVAEFRPLTVEPAQSEAWCGPQWPARFRRAGPAPAALWARSSWRVDQMCHEIGL